MVNSAPRQSLWRRLLVFDELGILAALVLFFLIGSLSSPYFLTVNNLAGILQNITFLGFLCIGVGLVLMAGEIDISVGSIFGLSGVVTALVLKGGYPLSTAIVSGLLVGIACGLVNGLIAQVIKVPVVVMTLATLGIYRALALALFLIIAVVAEIALRWTSSGFRLLAIGSNPQAAHLIGFHVERTRVLLLVFSGFIAGISGVCSVAYLDTASPTSGAGYELSVLAAVIIGGVKLSGSILGVLLGLCVIGIFQNLIVLWGVSPNWTQGVSGLVLIAAMTLIWLTRRNERAAGG